MLYIFAGIVGVLVLTLFIAMLWRSIVPQDEVHIVNTSKESKPYGDPKEVDEKLAQGKKSYGNVYYEFPHWIPVLGVVVKKLTLNVFQVNLDNYPAYDQDKVPFVVDFKSWFVIDNPIVAAKRIKDMSELKAQLQEMLQGIVRKTMAGKTIKEIMESRAELRDIFVKEVGEQCKDWGVKLNSIEFTDIRDMDGDEFRVIDDIKRVQSSAIEKERRVAEAENEKQARLSEIQSKREADLEDVIAKETVEKRDADRKKIVGIANEQAEQEIKEQAKLTKEKEVAVKRTEEVGTAEYQKEKVIIEANAKKEFEIIQAQAEQQSLAIEAEGQKEKDRLEGEGIAAKINAEGEAEANVIQKKGEAKAIALEKEAEAKKKLQEALKVELGALAIEAQKEVGVANAAALGKADIRILSGDGNNGQMARFLEGLAQNSTVVTSVLERLGIDTFKPELSDGKVESSDNAAKKPVDNSADERNVSAEEDDDEDELV